MTRKEIVKALRECSSGNMNCSKCPMWDSKIDLRCMDFAMKCAADMLEWDTKPKWISVKDRLPEVDVQVIVFAVGKYDCFIGTTTHAISTMLDRPSGKRWAVPWQYFDVDYEITHWMPLPEPPKEGMEC